MVVVASLIILSVAAQTNTDDSGRCDVGTPWPAVAKCHQQINASVEALEPVLRLIRSYGFTGRNEACTVLTYETGGSERCGARGCLVVDQGPIGACDGSETARPSPTFERIEAALGSNEVSTIHGVKVVSLTEGTATTWFFSSGRSWSFVETERCEQPVWLGDVTGFPSLGLLCSWGDAGALTVSRVVSVLHLIDLRKPGLASLTRNALVLGTGLVNAVRVIPGQTPTPATVPPPSFTVSGRFVVTGGRSYRFEAGWKLQVR